jgi:enediyne biosynthesis protein E4
MDGNCSAKFSHKAFLILAVAAGFASMIGSLSATQFTEVTDTAIPNNTPTLTFGNPVWGDINNDGYVDLIVPTFKTTGCTSFCTACRVYLNNGDGTFTDITADSNIVSPTPGDLHWRGFALGDYDGDGNLDLYISVMPTTQAAKYDLLFKGNGDGTFTYVSPQAGIERSKRWSQNSLWFDYNKDGLLDLFVKNFNPAVAPVEDPAMLALIGTVSGAAGRTFATNGVLDTIPTSISDDPSMTVINRLYVNNGNGTFSLVPGAAGLEQLTVFSGEIGHSDNCVFQDTDLDGDLDFTFSHDSTALALNDGGNFVQQPTSVIPRNNRTDTKGLAWGDFNNDGFPDLFVTSGSTQPKRFRTLLYHNDNGTFTAHDEVAENAGVFTDANTWVAVWGDYDNDGNLDLFVTVPAGTGDPLGTNNANLLFHNLGPDRNGHYSFEEVALDAGVQLKDNLPSSSHKAAAWIDYDNDGFLDLMVKDGTGIGTDASATGKIHLLKNIIPHAANNHFLKVNLKARTQSPHSDSRAIGALVKVEYGAGKIAFRENDGGGGGQFESQSSLPLHFGVASATTVTVTVNWPSGLCDQFTNVATNQTITFVEGSSPCE